MLTQARDKYQEVVSVAQHLFRQNPDWVTFFREVLGLEGIVRRAFAEPDELAEFEASPQYEEIQKLLTKLRERRGVPEKQTEPTRVITVRIPKSMHEALITEAENKHTSMNKLCISKLLQVIDEEFIPTPPPSSSRHRRKKDPIAVVPGVNPAANGEAPLPRGETDGEDERSAEEDL